MKVVVEFDVCASTGACTQVAPDVFEIRKDGYLYILVENPEGDVLVRAQEAADLCPTAAITIEE
jgi:ferredoxin